MTERKTYTPMTAALDLAVVFKILEGRWKLVILFHLFGGQVQRFSDLEKLIPDVTQKMLAQQLRRLEADGIVLRTDYQEVPPRVDYRLTQWGETLCPALDGILKWAESCNDFHKLSTNVDARGVRGARRPRANRIA
ncbi:MAG: helix-turn-helix domain-containing protein [Steroidobacteraceae bacterium]